MFSSPDPLSIVISYIFLVVSLIALFLLLREVFCWYWKINDIISLLTEIRDSLKKEKKEG